jgi:hypothetical protein
VGRGIDFICSLLKRADWQALQRKRRVASRKDQLEFSFVTREKLVKKRG